MKKRKVYQLLVLFVAAIGFALFGIYLLLKASKASEQMAPVATGDEVILAEPERERLTRLPLTGLPEALQETLAIYEAIWGGLQDQPLNASSDSGKSNPVQEALHLYRINLNGETKEVIYGSGHVGIDPVFQEIRTLIMENLI